MNEWRMEDIKQCVESANAQKGAVLRGAGFHGHALYVFLSTINIWWAQRFTWEYMCGMPPGFSVRTLDSNTLAEYYEKIKFDKIDLRSLGYDFEGLTYSELNELDES